MGTTVIDGVANSILSKIDYKKAFEQKVRLRNEIPTELLNTFQDERKTIKDGYSKHLYGEYEGKFIMLSYNKIHPFMPMFRITFHQSHWESYLQINEGFTDIFGEEFKNFLFSECPLDRLDLWADVPKSIRLIAPMVDFKRSKTERYVFSKRVTYYNRVLRPNGRQLTVYEKFLEPRLTRIEARLRGKSLHKYIRHYDQLSRFKRINPFKDIDFYYFQPKLIDLSQFSDAQVKRLRKFIYLHGRYNFGHARKNFDEFGNFKSTLWPLIKEATEMVNVGRYWRDKSFIPFLEG